MTVVRQRHGGGGGRRAPAVAGVAAIAAVALVAGCGRGSTTGGGASTAPTTSAPPPGSAPLHAIGPGEGALDLVVPAGYDDGADWIAPFEEQTGCSVHTTRASSPDEAVAMLHARRFDGASIRSGQALRLIRAGDVAQLDTALVRSYGDLTPGLREAPFATYRGAVYGIPYGFRANLLLWRTDAAQPAPDSLASVFDAASAARGRVAIPDDPMLLATAALYLAGARPDLAVHDPYELDRRQLAAAADLVSRRRGNIGTYALDARAVAAAVGDGRAVVGIGAIPTADAGASATVSSAVPREGATGSADVWMMASGSRHPSCMYLWLDYVSSPDVQAQVARHGGEAPANPKACAALATAAPGLCDSQRAEDGAFVRALALERTPLADCGDARGAACAGYADWVRAWRAATR
jgi:putative spermidine/putrescine transport system substrate-binding protein